MIHPALAVYRLAATALAPVAAWKLRRASAAEPALLARQRERRGDVAESGGELWLHAASVGEVNVATALAGALLARDPSARLVISTVTHTGAMEVARRFGDQPRVRHLFAPLDTPRRVRRWLERTRPAGLVLIEAELWPEMLAQCRKRSIPVALVNARIRPGRVVRDRRCGRLLGGLLDEVAVVCCQSAADLQRFSALGVAPSRLHVTGNVKLDAPPVCGLPADLEAWLRRLHGRRLWLAGSTHAGEETLLARAQQQLRERHRDALLVIVPRHPERAPSVATELRRAGLNTGSLDAGFDPEAVDALVIGRVGVLAGLYRKSELNLVGGSLVHGIGGHNLFEAACAGRPLLTGPWTDGQSGMVDGLKQAGALTEVADADEVAAQVGRLFDDRPLRRDLGERARRWAESRRGALDATLSALAPWLAAVESKGG